MLPISAVIATKDRPQILARLLQEIGKQSVSLSEIIVVDASEDEKSKKVCQSSIQKTLYLKASKAGAAPQRNEGVERSSQTLILFMDDDILIEEGCIEKLYQSLIDSEEAGGVSAMITNESYHPPGKLSQYVFRILNGKALSSYAGRCFGPGVAQLPSSSFQEAVEVDWLNAGCTLYRKAALPNPVFPKIFQGASTGEDLALSLQVAKRWRLLNCPEAKIYHDSQSGSHKRSIIRLALIELVNRHYIMRCILEKSSLTDYAKFALMMGYEFLGTLRSARGLREAPARLAGFSLAILQILRPQPIGH